ncbi:acyl-CoA oxidase [Longibacter salinarum]|uniref:acyl-CoA oxidase n=1 Tax=Longibacter salinarum TaxID=1850348 RepID=A0A2A8CZQ4_9BACT|nr:acyl-CoA dehydrogenase [Longibacter salinarum]PEN14110.1 acyl-CoA oxidase [Longibacter salinarum]
MSEADVSRRTLPESPDALALLPMLYVAWADGVLTPAEISLLRDRIESIHDLPSVVREEVCPYLDPSNPPSPEAYDRWVQVLREHVEALPQDRRMTLAEVGLSIASAGGDGAAVSSSVRAALTDLEGAVGVDGPGMVRELREQRPEPATGDRVTRPARFDIEKLTRHLDGDRHDHIDHMRTLLSDPAFAYPPKLTTPEYREQVMEWLTILADQGLGALSYPEEYGGGGDMGDFIATFEALAMHDQSLVVKYGVQFGLFGGSVYRLGTQKHHERYLDGIGSLEIPGCFAMSELGHGSNVRDIQTTATYDPETETFIISTPSEAARKEWIGNAAVHGELAVVFAQLKTQGMHHGVHAFIVPIRTPSGEVMPDVRIEDCGEKMGLNGVDNGRLWFDDVRVPRENLLDRFGTVAADGTYDSPIPSSGKRFFTMLGTLVGGRISVARAGLMAAKSGLTIAVRYGNRRRQFGPKDQPEVPLLTYRTHQRRLLPRLAKTYAIDAALQNLTETYISRSIDEGLEDVEASANALKAYATRHTTDTLQEAREACGGQGYLHENRISTLMADTDVFTTFEGDNTVLLLQVAKGLLSDFQREFRDLNILGMVRFVAKDVLERLSETNPLTSSQTDPEHLRSRDFQMNALDYRADRLLQTAAQRLRARLNDDIDPFDAFIDVQDHLKTLAEAHAERVTLEAFIQENDTVEDESVRAVLDRLRSLFALHAIETDRGWFLEAGVLGSAKSKAIRTEVNRLCEEVRPDAEALVDAFAIPDASLAAPIGTGDRH